MNTNVLTRAQSDRELVLIWLGDKSRTTRVSYSSIVTGFFDFINKPLAQVQIEDLQLWHRRLQLTDKPSTVANKIRAIKSLFSYGVKVGYLEINVGSYIKCPRVKEKLAQRILSESDCLKLIEATKSEHDGPNERYAERNRAILSLMYGCGLRVSEVCALTWGDLQALTDGGKCTVFGKGGETRVVLIPYSVWKLIVKQPKLIDAVFVSRTGKPLERTIIYKIVKQCAKRAGVSGKASCHWLRHSHASHAIESGCNLRLLQQSLGHSKLETTERYLHINPDRGSSQFINI
ncbi:tyrosine-type recombinase/integrase [Pleurocapsa sp. PCC 7319]|uniref:tyrosine-type recombinase/integrase n=1 Tax=Pleurocapsa sp. PCC 7319 TaxID=118161 RepID=UPI000346E094|nr:tyrosine-type recombinase/integrase [Pleurocapsa sp. PCC 7319]